MPFSVVHLITKYIHIVYVASAYGTLQTYNDYVPWKRIAAAVVVVWNVTKRKKFRFR